MTEPTDPCREALPHVADALEALLADGPNYLATIDDAEATLVYARSMMKRPNPLPPLVEALERIERAEVRSDRRHRGMCDVSIVRDLQRIARTALAKAKGEA